MEFLTTLIDFILHLDHYLIEMTSTYQSWTYLILFLVIFAETGLVVTPFLPGDSVLFAIGALIAKPETSLSLVLMYLLLCTAAILGDFTNYEIGKRFASRLFKRSSRIFKQAYLEKTKGFYEKHGPKPSFMRDLYQSLEPSHLLLQVSLICLIENSDDTIF